MTDAQPNTIALNTFQKSNTLTKLMNRFVKKYINIFKKNYNKTSTADKISSLALLATLFAILFSIYQFQEQRRQFEIQMRSNDIGDSINGLRIQKQIQLLEQKDSVERWYFNAQIESFRRRDSLERISYFQQKQGDSLQIDAQGKQLKVSVRPVLICEIRLGMSGRNAGIYLINVGLGPAIVKDYKFYIDRKEVESTQVLTQLFKELNPKFFGDERPDYAHRAFVEQSIIRAGEELALYSIPYDLISDPHFFAIFLYRTSVKVRYEGFSGESSNSLKTVMKY